MNLRSLTLRCLLLVGLLASPQAIVRVDARGVGTARVHPAVADSVAGGALNYDGLDLPTFVPLENSAAGDFVSRLKNALHKDDPVGPQLTLKEFILQAWPILEPAQPFVDNWHIDAIVEHLQGVTAGHIKNLIINIPPGCMKSRLVSVLWPAWEWTQKPHLRYLCISYAQERSTDDNVALRQLVESDWYQSNWPNVQIKDDQNQKTKFDTTMDGWRIGTSIGGRATGYHPHRKIIDDPHNVKQAESEQERKAALVFLSRTLPSRGLALGAATVLVMQRLHQDDATQEMLERLGDDDVVHLRLPMRFESLDKDGKSLRCVTVGSCTAKTVADEQAVTRLAFGPPKIFKDPRTIDGELLWPTMFPQDVVEKLAADEYLDAGQLQQRPSPMGGGMFKQEWLPVVDEIDKAWGPVVRRCRGWDMAATDENDKNAKTAAWTVGALLTLFENGLVLVEDVVRKRVGPGDDETLMKTVADQDGHAVKIREEREGGSAGKKVIVSHSKKLIGYDYDGISAAGRGNKEEKARPFAAYAKLGNVRLLRGEWNKPYISELTLFPNSTFKDQADASAIGFDGVAGDVSAVTFLKTTGH